MMLIDQRPRPAAKIVRVVSSQIAKTVVTTLTIEAAAQSATYTHLCVFPRKVPRPLVTATGFE